MATIRLHTISCIIADIFKIINFALPTSKRKRMLQKAIYKHKEYVVLADMIKAGWRLSAKPIK